MTDSNILDQYELKHRIYEECGAKIHQLVTDLLHENSIHVHSITYRVKEKTSLAEKISRKLYKYSEISQITDLVGVRIITHFDHQVDTISSIIEREFDVNRENSIDKRAISEPDRFGYLSLHLIVTLNASRAGLFEYRRFSGIPVEIQIRSILQHAWAEIEHDLGYKAEVEIPYSIRRRFSRIAGLLELADQEFTAVVNDLSAYRERLSSIKESIPDSTDIDSDALGAFAKASEAVRHLDYFAADLSNSLIDGEIDFGRAASLLHWNGIKDISELNEKILHHGNKMKSYICEMYKTAGFAFATRLPAGSSILFFCDYIAAAENDEYFVFEYLVQTHGFPHAVARTMSSQISEAANKARSCPAGLDPNPYPLI